MVCKYLPFSGALDIDSAVLAISIATAMNYWNENSEGGRFCGSGNLGDFRPIDKIYLW